MHRDPIQHPPRRVLAQRERGTVPTGIGLDEFARKVVIERRAWARLIKENDIRLE